MLDGTAVPPVDADEPLARFILFSKHFRPSDGTAKPDAFMPHPRIELSLTRHRQATPDELWQEGTRVAQLRSVTLYGRADILASAFREQQLEVVPAPLLPENPNHVNVVAWPADKSEQKMKAIELALRSQFVPRPE